MYFIVFPYSAFVGSGRIGICGWSGLVFNAAAIDPRIKATVASTMYDRSRVNAKGYFDSMDADARYELRKQLNAQRTEDAKNGTYALADDHISPMLFSSKSGF